MQLDIMLTDGENTLIIDAKYYAKTLQERFDKRTIHSNNLYQIFTYVKNQDTYMEKQRGEDKKSRTICVQFIK